MTISRRRFVAVLRALGLGALAPAVAAPRAEKPAPPSYAQVRERLRGKKIFVVPYAHNDYGWLNSNLWDRKRTPLVHKEALEVMRREPEFKWFLDVQFEALDWVLDRHPEIAGELERRVREGRFGVAPGSFCNPDNPFMEAEAVIRNLVLGRRTFERRFPGVNLEVAIFNDIHPGHSQMPQLLRQAGYRFYRFTRPMQALDRKGYRREFLWEGLDGSEILASYGPYGFGALGRIADINAYREDWPKAAVAFYESAVRDLLPNNATHLVYSPLGGDYTRPLRAFFQSDAAEPYLDLPGFVREWNRRESTPVVFATPIEYFREVDKSRTTLRRVAGTVDPVGWPFWYGSCGSRGLDNWRERNTRNLVEAELLSSMAALLGGGYPAKQLESLWYDKLTLDPHDGLYVGDEDVMELAALGHRVEHDCRRLGLAAVDRFGHRIAADPEKQAVALFNPLSWKRRALVQVNAIFPTPGTRRVRVVDAQGRTLPHQLLKVRHLGRPPGELYYKEAWMLVDAQLPASGYTTVYVEAQPGQEEALDAGTPVDVLESAQIRLKLGPGGIHDLEHRTRGVHYGGAGNPVYYAVKESWQYHGGPVTGAARVADARWRLVEDGPLRSTAAMTARLGAHRVELAVSLCRSLEQVDFELTIDSEGGNGYFTAEIPFGCPGSLTAGIPFGAESRDLSGEPFGEAAGLERLRENVFYAHHWVDYSDGHNGMTLLAAEGKRGFRFDPERRSLDHILLMTIVPVDEMEKLFANRFFRGTGRHTFRYSLLPHGGDWRSARSLHRAQERLYPVRWRHVHPRAGADLPLERSLLGVTPETVVVSAWFREGGSAYLRLYESAGQGGPVVVQLPSAPRACDSVDLNGRPRNAPPIELRQDTVRFPIRPWEIVTLRVPVEPAGERAS